MRPITPREAKERVQELLAALKVREEAIERVELFGSAARTPDIAPPPGRDIDIKVVINDKAPWWLKMAATDKMPDCVFNWDASPIKLIGAAFSPAVNTQGLLVSLFTQGVSASHAMMHGATDAREVKNASRLIDVFVERVGWGQPASWADTPLKKKWRRWRKDTLSRFGLAAAFIPGLAVTVEIIARIRYRNSVKALRNKSAV